MRQLKNIFTIFLLTISHLIFACDCGSAGEFLTAATTTELVALVKVTKYLTYKPNYKKQTPMSMEVEIIKTFKGSEIRKTITVWGDNGYLCRPYLSKFDTAKYYVIAFNKGSDGSQGSVHKDEKQTDYSISICGNYWLDANIDTKTASGSVSSILKSISFDNLWEKFNGEKIKELKLTDFKEFYQLALDLPELQPYYQIEKDTTRKQIYIQYFAKADNNNIEGVRKFDRQVILLKEKKIATKKIKNYFVFADWVYGQNYVRMQLSYVGTGLTISYLFKKVEDKWTIINHDLTGK